MLTLFVIVFIMLPQTTEAGIPINIFWPWPPSPKPTPKPVPVPKPTLRPMVQPSSFPSSLPSSTPTGKPSEPIADSCYVCPSQSRSRSKACPSSFADCVCTGLDPFRNEALERCECQSCPANSRHAPGSEYYQCSGFRGCTCNTGFNRDDVNRQCVKECPRGFVPDSRDVCQPTGEVPTAAPTDLEAPLCYVCPRSAEPLTTCPQSFDDCACPADRFRFEGSCICSSCVVRGGSCGGSIGRCGPVEGWIINDPKYSIASSSPSSHPSTGPSSVPSSVPSSMPSDSPTLLPSIVPSITPSSGPSSEPSSTPSTMPSNQPSLLPSSKPSSGPNAYPSGLLTSTPSSEPSSFPSSLPSSEPSSGPSTYPSSVPTSTPTGEDHSSLPSTSPSSQPSSLPTAENFSNKPSSVPSSVPSSLPSSVPSIGPSTMPSSHPSSMPSSLPSSTPSIGPSTYSSVPTIGPSVQPSSFPSSAPSAQPTKSSSDTASSFPLRINAGGKQLAVLTDDSKTWFADVNEATAQQVKIVGDSYTTQTDDDTCQAWQDRSLYCSERLFPQGGGYEITVPNGTYFVSLSFVNTVDSVFDIVIEGSVVRRRYDVMRAAWDYATETIGGFVSDGALSIEFRTVIGPATISAVEIRQA